MIAQNNVQQVEVKLTKMILGVQNWAQNQGFCHFLKVASLVSHDIAHDCSLGQCLTSSRGTTSKKDCGPNEGLTGPYWGLNYLLCSNVVSHPVKLACFKFVLRVVWLHVNFHVCLKNFKCKILYILQFRRTVPALECRVSKRTF